MMGRFVLRNVRKAFGDVVIIPALDLDIDDGEFVVFVGPSGCGKSTALRLVAGLGAPSAGTIDWPRASHDAAGAPEREIGFVFQEPTLMPWATVFENVFLPLKFQIHADADINLRQRTPIFTTNNNVALINGWIGKKFLKNDALLIKVAVNDLLNQNVGFNRNVSSNFISQNTYTTIKRYGMLSVVWNFTKAGTPMPPQRN